MALSLQGSGSSAATTVTIPAHAAGDLIVVLATGTAAAPTIPGAGGTVPTWASISSGINNSIGISAASAVATASNHTSGTWTNATHMHVLVFRSTAARTLSIGNVATFAGANNTQTIVYPALTFGAGFGETWAVRFGRRGTADTEVRTSGGFASGGTFRTEQPATTPTSATFTKPITADEAAFTATTAGTNAAYRAGSFEVREAAPSPISVSGGVATESDAAIGGAPIQRTYAEEVLADGPNLYWRLGESSGTVADDSTANNRDGTYEGTPALDVTGALRAGDDGAVDLDGVNDRIRITGYSPWSGAITIECWAKTDNYAAAGNKILAGNNAGSQLLIEPGGLILFFYAGLNIAGTGAWPGDGVWVHVVLTYDPAGQGTIYLNGQAGVPAAGGAYGGAPTDFQVGARTAAGSAWFNGQVDEVAVYPGLLSASRIRLHFDVGSKQAYTHQTPARESDSAPGGTVSQAAGQTISGGVASASNAAVGGTVVQPQLVAGGLATSSDSAPAGKILQTYAAAPTTEADSAPAGKVLQRYAAPPATSSEAAVGGTIVQPKLVAGGVATSSENVPAGKVLQTYSAAPVPESDAAPAGKVLQRYAAGVAAESDSTRAGTVFAPTLASGGTARESDAAVGGSVAQPQAPVAGGTAPESDAARAGAVSQPQAPVSGGRALEDDAARAGTVAQPQVPVAGGRATESDSTRAGTVSQPQPPLAGGTVAELDSAPAGKVLQTYAGGRATESDSATAGKVFQRYAAGTAPESDSAPAGKVLQRYAAGVAPELAAAAAGRVVETYAAPTAPELDAARGGAIVQHQAPVAGATAGEADAARAGGIIQPGGPIPGEVATEADSAPAGKVLQSYAAGTASEADAGAGGTVRELYAAGTAAELDAGRAGIPLQAAGGGGAAESDAARGGKVLQTYAAPVAGDAESVPAGVVLLTSAAGTAGEVDRALAGVVAQARIVPGGPAPEADRARAGAVSQPQAPLAGLAAGEFDAVPAGSVVIGLIRWPPATDEPWDPDGQGPWPPATDEPWDPDEEDRWPERTDERWDPDDQDRWPEQTDERWLVTTESRW